MGLESVIRELMRVFPTAASSRVTRIDGGIIETRRREIARNQVLLHCVAYNPGAEGSVVPSLSAGRPSAPLATVPPPAGAEFLNGALMALVSGDHCLFCTDGLTVGTLRFYVHELAKKARLHDGASKFDFSAVANRERVHDLIRSGVKSIGLNVTLDELDIRRVERETFAGRVRGELKDLVEAIVGREESVSDILRKDASNVTARLTISLNRRKSGHVTQDDFDEVAEIVADERDPGIFIKLRSGGRIDEQSIKISKKCAFQLTGTTIDHEEVWKSLREFFGELIESGYVDHK